MSESENLYNLINQLLLRAEATTIQHEANKDPERLWTITGKKDRVKRLLKTVRELTLEIEKNL